MEIDAKILCDAEFIKNVCDSSNCREIWAIGLELYTNEISINDHWYWIRPKSIEKLKFFEIFKKFPLNSVI